MASLNKKKRTLIGFLVAAIGLVIVGVAAVAAFSNNSLNPISKSSVDISKNFSVVARTKDGRPTDGTFPIKVTTAELTDNVLVQGKKATARNGKIFLVVYLEIENKYNVTLYNKPLDLLRLVRSDGKRIAPSVSQGDVEVRAISVKRTNVAFVVDKGEKNFTIEIGEIKGKKEAIQIKFN